MIWSPDQYLSVSIIFLQATTTLSLNCQEKSPSHPVPLGVISGCIFIVLYQWLLSVQENWKYEIAAVLATLELKGNTNYSWDCNSLSIFFHPIIICWDYQSSLASKGLIWADFHWNIFHCVLHFPNNRLVLYMSSNSSYEIWMCMWYGNTY